ncbi:MAG: hypothetical protein U1F98_17280 [Verrucomicrobiota bacterium]
MNATLLCAACLAAALAAHGQPASYTNDTVVAAYVKGLLYWPDADPANRSVAAFRYKHLLYADSGEIAPVATNMASLYGPAERSRAQAAEGYLRTGLSSNPGSSLLAGLLLDLYYDRSAAEFILAANALESANRARMGPPTIPTGLVIDDEIAACQSALNTLRSALTIHFRLLTDSLGAAGSPPAGFQWFKQLVPARGLDPAAYLSNGVPVSVTGDATPLFSGYKDLVLLAEGLCDYGRGAAALARLESMRNNSGDSAQARSLVTEGQRFLTLQLATLLGVFPQLDPQNVNDVDPASGLAEAIGGAKASLADLDALAQNLRGGSGPLGFADDFLMLVQKFAGQSGDVFDSFDALQLQLAPGNLSSPLRYAQDLLTSERASFDEYRGSEDQLELQLENVRGSAEDRLYQIAGAYPGTPEYNHPTNNTGSALWQQIQSIEVARTRIEKNKAEMDNLIQEVNIEIARAAADKSIVMRYNTLQSTLTREIAFVQAGQAMANSFSAAASSVNFMDFASLIGTAVNGANASIQYDSEINKGYLQQEKDSLAAMEQAEIEGTDSDAHVKTLMLGMKTLRVDSQVAVLLLQQEIARLVALLREKADLEQTLAGNQQEFTTRYFADPVHHLRYRHQTLLAHLSFDEAQKWLYFMARALEYKWNTPFQNYFYLGRKWSTATLFKLRNAEELGQFFNAMVSFNSLVQLPKDDYFDWFSVRDDFFGYKLTNDVGAVAYYPDPANPGGPATLTGIQAFRRRLEMLTNSVGDIQLPFSTVREIPGGTFFRGARFDQNGNVLSPGLFLDKIIWMQINLPGSHSLGRTTLAGQLTYGGSSFIRNFDVGRFAAGQPNVLQDELTTYGTRYWYFHAPSASWQFSAALQSPVSMQLGTDSRVPPTVQQITIFKERSVAATGWVLSIPTRDLGVPVLRINELNDVELYFYHYAVSRQVSAGVSAASATGPRSVPFPYNLKNPAGSNAPQ